MRARWLAAAAALCAVCLASACGSFAAPPTPTPVPPPPSTPTPAATAVPTIDAQAADVQDAFLTTVNDLTNEVQALGGARCPDLTTELQANPTELGSIRGFAATLQRVSTTQQALNSDDVRSALSDLSHAMTQLEAALNTCGIQQSP
jgi:hypothetical protein